MLFPRHPQPVGDNRPVAVKIIKQEQGQSGAVDRHVLVVDQPRSLLCPSPRSPLRRPWAAVTMAARLAATLDCRHAQHPAQ